MYEFDYLAMYNRETPYELAYISDEYNSKRIATLNGEATWWWLRSPGYSYENISFISCSGAISMTGDNHFRPSVGIRPALWIKLK